MERPNQLIILKNESIDFNDPDDQRQEWFPERLQVVSDPALARAIGFDNIDLGRGKILMHCGNTTFVYHSEFSKYMKVEGATS